MRSPASEGDCGVCVRVSWREGKQRALTDELDAKHQSDPYETLQTSDRKVFVSNTAAGAGRLLTDPQVRADDRVSPPTYGNDYWCVCCRRDRSAYVRQTHPMSTCIRAHDSSKTRGPHATK
ncbi:cleavage and polyadenylation specificity factor [Trypanosoma cruzi]|nr:cleavage and polyadenylation specificity factor [Trypanosoma cruzi]